MSKISVNSECFFFVERENVRALSIEKERGVNQLREGESSVREHGRARSFSQKLALVYQQEIQFNLKLYSKQRQLSLLAAFSFILLTSEVFVRTFHSQQFEQFDFYVKRNKGKWRVC